MRCLCCNKEIANPTEYEKKTSWHDKCIRTFWNTKELPIFELSDSILEELADRAVNRGLTVPGVQKKLSLHLETAQKQPRLTVVGFPSGYILKPQSEQYSCLPEAEFLVMKMAELAGVRTVSNALLRLYNGYAYICRRIDRKENNKLAMEDFCQLAGRITADKYKGSYENCGKIIRKYSQNTGLDIAEFYYRLLFCFVTGNSDMHYKNFSLIENASGARKFGLSAAYDMLPVNVILPEDSDETALALNGKRKNLKKKDFIQLAANLGLSEKIFVSFTKRILSMTEEFKEMIKNSYISDEMKEQMEELLIRRCERLA